MGDRSPAKDAIAALIIYGGTTVAVTAAFSAAVSLDLITAGQARGMQMVIRRG